MPHDKLSGSINWKDLAETLGSIDHGSDSLARQAIEHLLGDEIIKHAVDCYIDGGPGAELARHVLWNIRSSIASEYCYEIYKTHADLDRRRLAVELLRVTADRNAIRWIEELLLDPDLGIRTWGFGIVDQLLFSGLVEVDEVSHLIRLAEIEADGNLLENIDHVKKYLAERRARERMNDASV